MYFGFLQNTNAQNFLNIIFKKSPKYVNAILRRKHDLF